MNRDDLLNKIAILNTEMEKKENELYDQYVSDNSYKIGDIIHCKSNACTIKIEKIKVVKPNKYYLSVPNIIYSGIALKKNLELSKRNGGKATIFHDNNPQLLKTA
jgi:hypothetical protein